MEIKDGVKIGDNNFEIVGVLTKKDISDKVTSTGKKYLDGFINVEVNKENKVNSFKISVKFYELKADGTENQLYLNHGKKLQEEYNVGDTIKVSGVINNNEYYTNDLELRSYQKFEGKFFHKVDENEKQRAYATVDTYIQGIMPEEDKLKIQGYNLGYNNYLTELYDLYVPKELIEGFNTIYFEGTTGKLSIELENYSEVEEKTVQEQQAFGEVVNLTVETYDKYVKGLRIIGGQQPYMMDKAWTKEDIELGKQKREQKLEENKQYVMQKNQNNTTMPVTGFSSEEEKQIAEVESVFDENPFA